MSLSITYIKGPREPTDTEAPSTSTKIDHFSGNVSSNLISWLMGTTKWFVLTLNHIFYFCSHPQLGDEFDFMDSSLAVMDVKVRPMHAGLFTTFLEPPQQKEEEVWVVGLFPLWLRITGSVYVEGKNIFSCYLLVSY